MLRMIPLILASVLLAACGGDGGGTTPKKRPDGHVEGTAFDNVLQNADIKVYNLDGDVLGTAVTDQRGRYELTLNSVRSQVVKVVASNGKYKEEATNTIVELEPTDKLYAYVRYSQGGAITTAVTLYTTLAAGYAEYLMGTGTSPREAVEQANSSVSDMVGVDIVNTQPVDITAPRNKTPSLTNALRYSFHTAAVSPFTAWVSRESGREEQPHQVYNSIMFAQRAYEDVRHDGLLNGEGPDGEVTMGAVALDSQSYRNRLARNMLVVANLDTNKTGLGPGDLKHAAERYNQNTHAMFGEADPVPLDSEKPVVANPSWSDGETVAGEVTLSVDASDAVGVASVVFQIDGRDFVAQNPENPVVTFDSTQLPDAVHPVTVRVENFAGAVRNFRRDLTIANAGIEISDVHPADGQHIRGTYDFRASVTDPIGVADVLFTLDDGIQYSPDDLNEPRQAVDTTQVLTTEGEHTFAVRAENQGGFTDTYSGTFVIDNTAPQVDWPLPDDSYQSGDFDFAATISDNMELASARLFWDGEQLTDFVQGGEPTELNPSYTINTLQDFEGPHTLALEVTDRAGARTTETKTVNLDWNPPQVSFTTPSGKTVTGPYDLAWNVHDTNGIARQRLVFKDPNADIWVDIDTDKRSVNVAPVNGEGERTLEMQVTDEAGKTTTASILVNQHHLPPTLEKTSGSGLTRQYNAVNYSGGEEIQIVAVNSGGGSQWAEDAFKASIVINQPEPGRVEVTPDVGCGRREVARQSIYNPAVKLKVTDQYGLSSTKWASWDGSLALSCQEQY